MTAAVRPPGPAARALALADRALAKVELATAVIAGLVIFFVMWVGVAEIVLRKGFNAPLYGQLDLIEQTMALYAILSISYCWRLAGHIRVDLLIDQFHGRARWVVEFGTTLAALALVTAIWPGILHFFENALDIGDSTMNTRWPTWPSKLVPVVAFSILWVRLALELVGFARLIACPDAEPIAVPRHPDPVREAVGDADAADPGLRA
ncbi:TRAP-type mannitol/chloroaromatic compound transport system permease small subunit [Stella humosa]|uniref:TRAP transporter small permease protein n=1 Tax=Stella humosa TaxID=94 RepID=A0A3N1KZ35_9PROT|nr:TRAP transporter small permease [Stella humosa]ROP83446.1 TRAP-type mannitol/chloroaromatic compound transport system permease small subunit [Stella humosa]BBK33282.1 hypothetical protein STHU_39160 [Stella humosa]